MPETRVPAMYKWILQNPECMQIKKKRPTREQQQQERSTLFGAYREYFQCGVCPLWNGMHFTLDINWCMKGMTWPDMGQIVNYQRYSICSPATAQMNVEHGTFSSSRDFRACGLSWRSHGCRQMGRSKIIKKHSKYWTTRYSSVSIRIDANTK